MDRLLRASIPTRIAVVGDALAVIVFVLIGRRNHENGYALGGLILALIPFLLGLAAGWGLIRWRSHAWPHRVLHGVTLAVATLVVALVVRPLMGQSLGDGIGGFLSFGAVGLGFLLLFIVGWRILAAFALPAPARPSTDRSHAPADSSSE